MNKLIKIFKADSIKHLALIFLVFGISGSLSVLLSEPLLNYFNFKSFITYYPLYIFLRIIVIFPIYQLVLIIVAIFFGQYKYFIKFEKKIFNRLKFF